MKLSEINPDKLNNDLIKKIFFDIKKEEYDYADYIIIYGCHIKQLLDERLIHALFIIQNKKYNKIVLTGGIGAKGDFNESEYMYNFLIKNGVDKDRILIENKSTTTEENNINLLEMLELNLINKKTNIVLVSQELHMLRLILHWEKLLNNPNIEFYYDYTDDSILSYEKSINNPKVIELLKEQTTKIVKFINDGVYSDYNLDE